MYIYTHIYMKHIYCIDIHILCILYKHTWIQHLYDRGVR